MTAISHWSFNMFWKQQEGLLKGFTTKYPHIPFVEFQERPYRQRTRIAKLVTLYCIINSGWAVQKYERHTVVNILLVTGFGFYVTVWTPNGCCVNSIKFLLQNEVQLFTIMFVHVCIQFQALAPRRTCRPCSWCGTINRNRESDSPGILLRKLARRS